MFEGVSFTNSVYLDRSKRTIWQACQETGYFEKVRNCGDCRLFAMCKQGLPEQSRIVKC